MSSRKTLQLVGAAAAILLVLWVIWKVYVWATTLIAGLMFWGAVIVVLAILGVGVYAMRKARR